MKKLMAFGSIIVLMSLVQIYKPNNSAEPNEPSVFKNEILLLVRGVLENFIDQGYRFDPNAPEGEIRLIRPTEKIYNVSIPTWPDYIELDKDLVIDAQDYLFVPLPKGTTIYFKETTASNKELISLEDWNKKQVEIYENIFTAAKNGIACPECGKELYDTNNGIAYPTYPMQYPVHCDCGWSGTRY